MATGQLAYCFHRRFFLVEQNRKKHVLQDVTDSVSMTHVMSCLDRLDQLIYLRMYCEHVELNGTSIELTEMRENIARSFDMFRKFMFAFDLAEHCCSRIIE
jgi:hypothetical protein